VCLLHHSVALRFSFPILDWSPSLYSLAFPMRPFCGLSRASRSDVGPEDYSMTFFNALSCRAPWSAGDSVSNTQSSSPRYYMTNLRRLFLRIIPFPAFHSLASSFTRLSVCESADEHIPAIQRSCGFPLSFMFYRRIFPLTPRSPGRPLF